VRSESYESIHLDCIRTTRWQQDRLCQLHVRSRSIFLRYLLGRSLD
jgi:hypothetical protein